MKPISIRRSVAFSAALILVAAGKCHASTQGEEIQIVGDGAAAVTKDLAAVEEEAVWDAKRNAVEKAAGIFLRARAVGRDFQLAEDEIEGRTNGFIKKWEILPGSRKIEAIGNGRVLRLQVKATVALLAVVRKLADIKDVYEDLERPRIRIEIVNDSARRVTDAISAALKAEGYEVSTDEKAELLLTGQVEYTPTLRLGDTKTPYGVGEKLAACRARVSMRVVSFASESVLLTTSGHGSGRSFTSDSEARAESAESAADNLILQSRELLRENLLVRWARERQEGHIIAVKAGGLDSAGRDAFRQHLAAMRGFRKLVSEKDERGGWTFRVLTRLDTRAIRRRLAELSINSRRLTVIDSRGPTITCAARPVQRASAKAAETRD